MRFLHASALRALPLLLLGLGVVLPRARADLVWSPQTGWSIQGGALLGLTGAEGRTALDMMNKARADQEKGHNHAALKLYSKVTKRYGTSIFAAEALYQTAKIRMGRHQYYKAFEAYQEIIARYPNDKRYSEIIGHEYRIASLLLDGARNRIFGLIPGFRNRERAIGYFEVIVSDAPYSDYAPLALMSAARGYEYLHAPEEAIDALDRMVNGYQQSVLVPYAYLELAKAHAAQVQGAYYDQGETKQSITYYEDFMILFPGDPNIAEAAQGLDRMKQTLAESKMKAGDFYFYKRDNFTAARVFYNEAITSYPDSDVARRARVQLARVEAKARSAPLQAAPKKKHFLFF